MLFGFLGNMINCDFQKWMKQNVIFQHFVGITAFFFLFSVIEVDDTAPLRMVWMKTLFVYGVFLMMVKSKWYVSLPIFLILIADQSLKLEYNFLKKNNENDTSLPTIDRIRNSMNIIIVIGVVVGFVLYAIRQKREFGSHFSWIKFIFHSTCKAV
jgi:hypothetical protein